MKICTENELANLCSEWQDKLRLSHWDIAVRIARTHEMHSANCQGSSQISLPMERALISILDADDYPPSPFKQNMEVSLVHELLHIPILYFSNPEENSLECIHQEAFIENMARLLVKLSKSTPENE